MKYNLSPDLISTELIPWVDDYIGKHPNPESEYYPPALWSDVAQTRAEYNGVITDPSAQKDIKYVYSRAYRPYGLFTQHWDTLNPKILHGKNAYTIKVDNDVIQANIIETDVISTDSLHVWVSGKFDSISAHSITSINEAGHHAISSSLGIVEYIRGTEINKYDNANFTNITASGIAQLTAFCAKWADIAELYESDNLYDAGTLVEFEGNNEITLATNYVNGCISERPAVLLNSAIRKNINSLPVVLCGKTRVKVTGPINKFDRLELSNTPGIAQAHSSRKIIGIALETNSKENIKLVESIVKLTL